MLRLGASLVSDYRNHPSLEYNSLPDAAETLITRKLYHNQDFKMNRMNRTKVPPKVLAIFEKYQETNVRNLKKEDAIHMLMTEFSLDTEQAENIFKTFDKNEDGIMSIWEFKMFFDCAGDHANEIVDKFRALDADGSGKLDIDEARAGLKTLTTGTGRLLDDREIEFFLQTTGTDDKTIDLGHFINLLHRLKLYNAPAPKAGVKLHTSST